MIVIDVDVEHVTISLFNKVNVPLETKTVEL